MHKLNALLLAVSLAIISAQAAGQSVATPVTKLTAVVGGESVLTMRVDGELTIGTEGQVLTYNIRSKLDQSVQAMLAKAIPQWRLRPVRQGDKPVLAKTPMRITLAATPIPAGYEVRIDNVVFTPLTPADYEEAKAFERAAYARGERITSGDETPHQMVVINSEKLQPPGYPSGLLMAGVEGIVLMTLRLNQDGTVAEAFASQSSLLNIKGKPGLLDKARALLEKQSLLAAKGWRFKIEAEQPASLTAADLSVRVPVEFKLSAPRKEAGASFAGSWRNEFRGPNLPIPWLLGKPGEQVVGVSDLNNGEQVSGSSPFQLSDRSVLNRAL